MLELLGVIQVLLKQAAWSKECQDVCVLCFLLELINLAATLKQTAH